MEIKLFLKFFWRALKREMRNAKFAVIYCYRRRPLSKPIFILCSERSGSTLFISYLNSDPNIKVLGDILSSRLANGLRRSFMPKKWALNHIRHLLNFLPQPFYGAKIFFSDLSMRRLSLKDFSQNFPEAKWIVLYRRNILDQYISLKMAVKTGQWTWRSEGFDSKFMGGKINVFTRGALGYQRRIKKCYADILKFPEVCKRSLWVSYEELSENPQKLFHEAVFPFLNILDHPIHTTLMKQNIRQHSEVIANYENVEKLLRDNDFAQSYPRFPVICS